MDEARRSKINDFNLALRVGLDKNILRFQITMDQVKIMDEIESIQDLLGHFLKSWHVKVMLLFNLSVVL